MSKARLVITALFIEGQTASEVAARYGVHRAWVYKLKARYLAEGEAAFEARSRRPKTSPRATPAETVELVLALRKQLTEQGLDAGADTIGWHLGHHHATVLSRATIHRILVRAGSVVPDPGKRPRSSYVRFAAEQPNECWQSDFTHYRLTTAAGRPGTDVEIISWLDDHSRYALTITAHVRITGQIVLASFGETVAQYGIPASTLTDNGMVYTTRLSGGKGGRNGLETELRRLNITQKNSRPNHPTTCGKVERFQQTMKKWLRAQPIQPTTLSELQTLLDTFTDEYNQRRPHRSLPHRATPATAYAARPKATPGTDRTGEVHHRVRTDRVDHTGVVTLRVNGRLHHIGIGRTHARTHVLILAHDLEIRVVDAATGELLRELTLDPTKDYQPTGRPPGPARKHPK
ncbi:IS481 family transposase [Kribbella sp. CA-293567]|uniref:IS481 family transposase n=1 Tax=Kribbella sp. CA-293567 TaxID=3002436 RepID=UPI0022DE4831|nr:IS481 family transposase [Kribbella sp. CA-293567]WBQ05256.1 IS481 family transposase [Kribbella sp. CA-293567]WBQ06698.1 IS481 family transposase [Kribbella sp. CA-293567]